MWYTGANNTPLAASISHKPPEVIIASILVLEALYACKIEI